jgi:hypothetical protein
MKPKTGQPRSGSVRKPPLRVSARIAEQKQQPSKQVHIPPKPLAPKAAWKRATEGKQKPSRSKKPAPAKSKKIAEKKNSTPRPSYVPSRRRVQKKALQEHERRTAQDPLPQDLAKVSRLSK